MNRDESNRQPKMPIWAWAFVVACSAIPVVSLGGAIPAAIGAAGAVTCYGLSRDGKGSPVRRATLCSLVTLLCWSGFGAVVWVVVGSKEARPRVAQSSKPVPASKSAAELNEDERREIYLDAIERRARMEEKQEEIDDRRADGRSTRVLEKQLGVLETMHESHLKRVASRNDLTPAELDAIIDEGDYERWNW